MPRFLHAFALGVTLLATGAASAGDCTSCCQPEEHRGFLSRLRARFSPTPNYCGRGKTHLDIGCTDARASCIFAFGSCCEFFDHPETYQGFRKFKR